MVSGVTRPPRFQIMLCEYQAVSLCVSGLCTTEALEQEGKGHGIGVRQRTAKHDRYEPFHLAWEWLLHQWLEEAAWQGGPEVVPRR